MSAWTFGRSVVLMTILAASLSSPALASLSFALKEFDGGTFVVVSGTFDYSDNLDEFSSLVRDSKLRFVTFDSPGGNVPKAIELGRLIRQYGLNTGQLRSLQCDSACAFAFVGGVGRYADPGAIGVHRASLSDSGNMDVNSAVTSIQELTALEISYLTDMGVDPAVLQVALNYGSDDIRYLSGSEMQQYRVVTESAVAPEGGSKAATINPPPAVTGAAPQQVARQIWSTYGEWIQIFSRQVLDNAVDLAATYRTATTNPLVFSYDNGWFVGAIGPFKPGTAGAERNRLIIVGAIPGDSLVVTGSRFEELVAGQVSDLTLAAQSTDLPSRAITAAQTYEQTWSASNQVALGYLDSIYAPQIEYFGKPTPKQEVMHEKVAFAARWPDRSYVIEPGSAKATCTSDGLCSVQGVVDWHVSSATRGATSIGSASFDLVFSMSDPIRLVSESSQVLTRQTNTSVAATTSLPMIVGECRDTTIAQVMTRLEGVPGSGSAISYANGGYQVSYDQIAGMDSSRIGDPVTLCLTSIPTGCPPGDNRGRVYRATNLRTGRSWEEPDSEHTCGGA